ncbi:MAG: GNAT family N-acetyltransferase [Chloroflexi bacterium]|nr:GNAT family N-acetyltransferase [Chloroflexota bacterium]MCI0649392.1 GNAT family N-acetyltransferase [Chloroflexota bacterium]MCI0727073.1 GNAT family N-acetyltransferase [Chloroflexota bacterium]
MEDSLNLVVYPATGERWGDLEALFGEKGACGGCWCTFWRLPRSQHKQNTGSDNKAELQHLVQTDQVPGLLAYVDGQPAAWCSIGPREQFAALENSRNLKRVDDRPVWSIVCFFTAKPYRRQGLMAQVLAAAVEYARQQGETIVEGYPIDMATPKLAGQRLSGSSGYMGIASAFRQAGFVEVARASETQRIMRYYL